MWAKLGKALEGKDRASRPRSRSTTTSSSSKARQKDGYIPSSTAFASSSRSTFEATAAPSIASSYATASSKALQHQEPRLIRTESVRDRREHDQRSRRSRSLDRAPESIRDRSRSRSRDERRGERRRRRSRSRDRDEKKGKRREKRDRKDGTSRTLSRSQTEDGYGATGSTRAVPADDANVQAASPSMQFGFEPSAAAPYSSPAPNASLVTAQFPGQFPSETTAPYRPPMSIREGGPGLAADYYGDQAPPVVDQPSPRPANSTVRSRRDSRAHSPSGAYASPTPGPSSAGAADSSAYFYSATGAQRPPSGWSASVSGTPTRMSTSSAPQNAQQPQLQPSHWPSNGSFVSSPERPHIAPSTSGSHSHSTSAPVVPTLGAAAAGAAAGYLVGQHGHSGQSSHQGSGYPSKPASYYGGPLKPGKPPGASTGAIAGSAFGYNSSDQLPAHGRPYAASPLPAASLALKRRPRGPVRKFLDFWKDPQAVGQYEEYSEYVGVCKGCFDPGSTPRDAPRKHHHGRRRSWDCRSTGSRVDKESRYYSSDASSGRSRKNRSWITAGLAGYGLTKVGKSLFSQKNDSWDAYSARSGRASAAHRSTARESGDDFAASGELVLGRADRSSGSNSRSSSSSGHGAGAVAGSVSKSTALRRKDHKRRKGKRSSTTTTTTVVEKSRRRSRSDSSSSDRKRGAVARGVTASVASGALSHRRRRSRSRSRPKRSSAARSPSRRTVVTFAPDLARLESLDRAAVGRTSLSTGSRSERLVLAADVKPGSRTAGHVRKPIRKGSRRGAKSSSSSSSSSSELSSTTSSVDFALAFGSGVSRRGSRDSLTSKRATHGQGDATLLGIGAAAAALFATNQVARSRNGKRASASMVDGGFGLPIPGLGKSAASAYRRPAPSHPSGPDDEGWESASDDEGSSSGHSSLAFGSYASGKTIGHRKGRESSSSSDAASGTDKWNWHWGRKPAKQRKEGITPAQMDPASLPFHEPAATGNGEGVGHSLAASAFPQTHDPSPARGYSNEPPLQEVYAVPTSDPTRFDVQPYEAVVPLPSQVVRDVRPVPVPLQHPQPQVPVPSAVYTRPAPIEPSFTAPADLPRLSGLPAHPIFSDVGSREQIPASTHRASTLRSGTIATSGAVAGTTHAAGDVAAQRQSEQANRREAARRERAKRREADERAASERHQARARRESRRSQQQAPLIVEREDPGHGQAVSTPGPGFAAVAGFAAAAGAATAIAAMSSSSAADAEHRTPTVQPEASRDADLVGQGRRRDVEPYAEEVHPRPEEPSSKKVVDDHEDEHYDYEEGPSVLDKYKQADLPMASYMDISGIIAQSPTRSTLVDDEQDLYHVPAIVTIAPPDAGNSPAHDRSYGFAAASQDRPFFPFPWAIPRLNLINPTPPRSKLGSVSSVRSGPSSPVPRVEDVTDVVAAAEAVLSSSEAGAVVVYNRPEPVAPVVAPPASEDDGERSRLPDRQQQVPGPDTSALVQARDIGWAVMAMGGKADDSTPVHAATRSKDRDVSDQSRVIVASGDRSERSSWPEASQQGRDYRDPPEVDQAEQHKQNRASASRSPRVPGEFIDDTEFAATLAAGLEDTGFDPSIVLDDPSFGRRKAPSRSGSNIVMAGIVPTTPLPERLEGQRPSAGSPARSHVSTNARDISDESVAAPLALEHKSSSDSNDAGRPRTAPDSTNDLFTIPIRSRRRRKKQRGEDQISGSDSASAGSSRAATAVDSRPESDDQGKPGVAVTVVTVEPRTETPKAGLDQIHPPTDLGLSGQRSLDPEAEEALSNLVADPEQSSRTAEQVWGSEEGNLPPDDAAPSAVSDVTLASMTAFLMNRSPEDTAARPVSQGFQSLDAREAESPDPPAREASFDDFDIPKKKGKKAKGRSAAVKALQAMLPSVAASSATEQIPGQRDAPEREPARETEWDGSFVESSRKKKGKQKKDRRPGKGIDKEWQDAAETPDVEPALDPRVSKDEAESRDAQISVQQDDEANHPRQALLESNRDDPGSTAYSPSNQEAATFGPIGPLAGGSEPDPQTADQPGDAEGLEPDAQRDIQGDAVDDYFAMPKRKDKKSKKKGRRGAPSIETPSEEPPIPSLEDHEAAADIAVGDSRRFSDTTSRKAATDSADVPPSMRGVQDMEMELKPGPQPADQPGDAEGLEPDAQRDVQRDPPDEYFAMPTRKDKKSKKKGRRGAPSMETPSEEPPIPSLEDHEDAADIAVGDSRRFSDTTSRKAATDSADVPPSRRGVQDTEMALQYTQEDQHADPQIQPSRNAELGGDNDDDEALADVEKLENNGSRQSVERGPEADPGPVASFDATQDDFSMSKKKGKKGKGRRADVNWNDDDLETTAPATGSTNGTNGAAADEGPRFEDKKSKRKDKKKNNKNSKAATDSGRVTQSQKVKVVQPVRVSLKNVPQILTTQKPSKSPSDVGDGVMAAAASGLGAAASRDTEQQSREGTALPEARPPSTDSAHLPDVARTQPSDADPVSLAVGASQSEPASTAGIVPALVSGSASFPPENLNRSLQQNPVSPSPEIDDLPAVPDSRPTSPVTAPVVPILPAGPLSLIPEDSPPLQTPLKKSQIDRDNIDDVPPTTSTRSATPPRSRPASPIETHNARDATPSPQASDPLPPLPESRPTSPLIVGSTTDLPSLPHSRPPSPTPGPLPTSQGSPSVLSHTSDGLEHRSEGFASASQCPQCQEIEPSPDGQKAALGPVSEEALTSLSESPYATHPEHRPDLSPAQMEDLPPLQTSRPTSPVEIGSAADLPALPDSPQMKAIDELQPQSEAPTAVSADRSVSQGITSPSAVLPVQDAEGRPFMSRSPKLTSAAAEPFDDSTPLGPSPPAGLSRLASNDDLGISSPVVSDSLNPFKTTGDQIATRQSSDSSHSATNPASSQSSAIDYLPPLPSSPAAPPSEYHIVDDVPPLLECPPVADERGLPPLPHSRSTSPIQIGSAPDLPRLPDSPSGSEMGSPHARRSPLKSPAPEATLDDLPTLRNDIEWSKDDQWLPVHLSEQAPPVSSDSAAVPPGSFTAAEINGLPSLPPSRATTPENVSAPLGHLFKADTSSLPSSFQPQPRSLSLAETINDLPISLGGLVVSTQDELPALPERSPTTSIDSPTVDDLPVLPESFSAALTGEAPGPEPELPGVAATDGLAAAQGSFDVAESKDVTGSRPTLQSTPPRADRIPLLPESSPLDQTTDIHGSPRSRSAISVGPGAAASEDLPSQPRGLTEDSVVAAGLPLPGSRSISPIDEGSAQGLPTLLARRISSAVDNEESNDQLDLEAYNDPSRTEVVSEVASGGNDAKDLSASEPAHSDDTVGRDAAEAVVSAQERKLPTSFKASHSFSQPRSKSVGEVTMARERSPRSPSSATADASARPFSPKKASEAVVVSPGKNSSPTAIPIHFRRPRALPGHQRMSWTGPASVQEGGSSPPVPRTRHFKAGSTEFKPLYLVERHNVRQMKDPEGEAFPPLPPSRSSTAGSATHSEDEADASADKDVEGPLVGKSVGPLRITTQIDQDSAEWLGSGEPTPRGFTFEHTTTMSAPDHDTPMRPSEHMVDDAEPRSPAAFEQTLSAGIPSPSGVTPSLQDDSSTQAPPEQIPLPELSDHDLSLSEPVVLRDTVTELEPLPTSAEALSPTQVEPEASSKSVVEPVADDEPFQDVSFTQPPPEQIPLPQVFDDDFALSEPVISRDTVTESKPLAALVAGALPTTQVEPDPLSKSVPEPVAEDEELWGPVSRKKGKGKKQKGKNKEQVAKDSQGPVDDTPKDTSKEPLAEAPTQSFETSLETPLVEPDAFATSQVEPDHLSKSVPEPAADDDEQLRGPVSKKKGKGKRLKDKNKEHVAKDIQGPVDDTQPPPEQIPLPQLSDDDLALPELVVSRDTVTEPESLATLGAEVLPSTQVEPDPLSKSIPESAANDEELWGPVSKKKGKGKKQKGKNKEQVAKDSQGPVDDTPKDRYKEPLAEAPKPSFETPLETPIAEPDAFATPTSKKKKGKQARKGKAAKQLGTQPSPALADEEPVDVSEELLPVAKSPEPPVETTHQFAISSPGPEHLKAEESDASQSQENKPVRSSADLVSDEKSAVKDAARESLADAAPLETPADPLETPSEQVDDADDFSGFATRKKKKGKKGKAGKSGVQENIRSPSAPVVARVAEVLEEASSEPADVQRAIPVEVTTEATDRPELARSRTTHGRVEEVGQLATPIVEPGDSPGSDLPEDRPGSAPPSQATAESVPPMETPVDAVPKDEFSVASSTRKKKKGKGKGKGNQFAVVDEKPATDCEVRSGSPAASPTLAPMDQSVTHSEERPGSPEASPTMAPVDRSAMNVEGRPRSPAASPTLVPVDQSAMDAEDRPGSLDASLTLVPVEQPATHLEERPGPPEASPTPAPVEQSVAHSEERPGPLEASLTLAPVEQHATHLEERPGSPAASATLDLVEQPAADSKSLSGSPVASPTLAPVQQPAADSEVRSGSLAASPTLVSAEPPATYSEEEFGLPAVSLALALVEQPATNSEGQPGSPAASSTLVPTERPPVILEGLVPSGTKDNTDEVREHSASEQPELVAFESAAKPQADFGSTLAESSSEPFATPADASTKDFKDDEDLFPSAAKKKKKGKRGKASFADMDQDKSISFPPQKSTEDVAKEASIAPTLAPASTPAETPAEEADEFIVTSSKKKGKKGKKNKTTQLQVVDAAAATASEPPEAVEKVPSSEAAPSPPPPTDEAAQATAAPEPSALTTIVETPVEDVDPFEPTSRKKSKKKGKKTSFKTIEPEGTVVAPPSAVVATTGEGSASQDIPINEGSRVDTTNREESTPSLDNIAVAAVEEPAPEGLWASTSKKGKKTASKAIELDNTTEPPGSTDVAPAEEGSTSQDIPISGESRVEEVTSSVTKNDEATPSFDAPADAALEEPAPEEHWAPISKKGKKKGKQGRVKQTFSDRDAPRSKPADVATADRAIEPEAHNVTIVTNDIEHVQAPAALPGSTHLDLAGKGLLETPPTVERPPEIDHTDETHGENDHGPALDKTFSSQDLEPKFQPSHHQDQSDETVPRIRDSGVLVSDSPLVSSQSPALGSVRDSGFQDALAGDLSLPRPARLSMVALPDKEPEQERIFARAASPVEVPASPPLDLAAGTAFDGPQSAEAPALLATAPAAAPIGDEADEQDPANDGDELLKEDQDPRLEDVVPTIVERGKPIEGDQRKDTSSQSSADGLPPPSPVESTSKDRDSVLFASPPQASTKSVQSPGSPLERAKARAEFRRPDDSFAPEPPRSVAEEEISSAPDAAGHGPPPQPTSDPSAQEGSTSSTDDDQLRHRSIFGGPVGVNSDADAHGDSRIYSPGGTRQALDPIAEDFSDDGPLLKPAPSTPKRRRKAYRPLSPPESALTPEPSKPLHEQSSKALSSQANSDHGEANAAGDFLSTDALISRLSWPAVDDDAETVDLDRAKSRGSQRPSSSTGVARPRRLSHNAAATPDSLWPHRRDMRSPSGNSVGSNPSLPLAVATRLNSPDSVDSRHSAGRLSHLSGGTGTGTPPLRRADRRFSGDLRGASKREATRLAGKDDADRPFSPTLDLHPPVPPTASSRADDVAEESSRSLDMAATVYVSSFKRLLLARSVGRSVDSRAR